MKKHNSQSIITTPEPGSLPVRHSFFKRFKSHKQLDFLPSPEKINKKILLLDLDETLIHHSTFPPHSEIEFFSLSDDYVFLRPGVREFLHSVVDVFEVYIFTASIPEYANAIMDELFPAIPPDHRICRDRCKVKKKEIRKDIKIFKCDPSSIVQPTFWLWMPRT